MKHLLFTLALLLWSSLAAAETDVRPLPLKIEHAFPNINWEGWSVQPGDADEYPPYPFRPVLVTHAGDGSGRRFVAEQHGVIYVVPPGKEPAQGKVFLDISKLVSYSDRENEEGFLGVAFHPRYAENGQFVVYYTNLNTRHQNLVVRYRVSKEDPDRADPQSTETLLTLDKPFWNHDGGSMVFGPDGYLYIATGDGGSANDPFGNGQNLGVLLAKVLRIDVDHRAGKLPYAIPADNPFVGQAGARGEIWAYGVRNIWRMAFDRETKVLWAADVGQDTWEEIDLIVRGGNYGWNHREGLHKRPLAKEDINQGMIDPIFEYHHDLGKSITGGFVYRGESIPELRGGYLYADYVAGRMWALWYDAGQKQIVANREIPLPKSFPIMSFGEDQEGTAYFMTDSLKGTEIYRLSPNERR